MNGKETIEKAIDEVELEWGWEGIRESMHEIMKPIEEDLEALNILLDFVVIGGLDKDTSRCWFPYMGIQPMKELSKEQYDKLKDCYIRNRPIKIK